MKQGITRWEPFKDLLSLQEEVNRLFSNFWSRGRSESLAEGFWTPVVDVEETPDEVVVKAELPGLKKNEIRVQIAGDTLTISGERKQESETKGKSYYRMERHYGQFQRILTLPAEVKATQAKATFENGLLILHLPRVKPVREKEITIPVE